MKDAVIFAGGGARGIFQLGAYLALKAYEEFDPVIFGGSSVGALNAAFFAAGKDDILTKAWTDIKGKPSLYFPSDFLNDKSKLSLSWLGVFRIIRHLFTRKKVPGLVSPNLQSILKNLSLKDLIDRSPDNIRLIINAVSLKTGLEFSANELDFPSDEEFHKMLIASASFPGIFPAVDDIVVMYEVHNFAVDAGIREVTTLRQIIQEIKFDDDIRLTIINCNITNPLPSIEDYNSIEKNILRSIDIARHTIFKQEIALFKERNKIGEPHYRRFTYRIIEPDPFEAIGVMDFSSASLDRLYQHGKEQALTAEWVD